jgi:hypothetical protein
VSVAEAALATCERLGARPAIEEAADLPRLLTGGAAVSAAIAPCRAADGGYRLRNKFRYLVAERP